MTSDDASLVRTQIQLTQQQHRWLKDLAARRGVSVAELVRQGVEQVLADSQGESRWRALWSVAGTCHDDEGASDVSARHDDYLSRAFSHGHRIR